MWLALRPLPPSPPDSTPPPPPLPAPGPRPLCPASGDTPAFPPFPASRPGLAPRLHELVSGTSVLGQIEETLRQYLTAEQRLGRLSPGADARTGATVLLGAVHHLVFTGRASGPEFAGEVERTVDTVLSGIEAGERPGHAAGPA